MKGPKFELPKIREHHLSSSNDLFLVFSMPMIHFFYHITSLS